MSVAFPTTAQLSEFLDPPENPLSEGGAWAQVRPASPPLKKVGGAAGDSIHNGTNYSYWTPTVYYSTSIVEVWACTEGGQLGAAVETWRVALWTVLGDAFTGYLAYYGGGIGKAFVIRRYDAGAFTEIIGVGGGYPAKLGLRIDGANVECWATFPGDPDNWILMCSIADTTYRGAFWLSLGIEDPTGGGLNFPCFGGGQKNRTQIYRILRV